MSGLIHEYIFYAMNLKVNYEVLLFFLIQSPLISLEDHLRGKSHAKSEKTIFNLRNFLVFSIFSPLLFTQYYMKYDF